MKFPTLSIHTASLYTLFALGCASASAQYNIIYTENFDPPTWANGAKLTTTPLNGWTGSDNGSSLIAEISNAQAASGTQSLYLSDQGSGSATARHILQQNYAAGYVQFAFRQQAGNNFAVRFGNIDSGGTNNFDIVIGDAGWGNGFYIRNSGGDRLGFVSFSSVGYAFGDWDTIRVVFDNDTKSASILLNNNTTPILTVSPDTDAGASSVDWQVGSVILNAGWSSGTGYEGYFDNIAVGVQIPEASTYAMIGGLACLAALCLRRRRS